MPFTAWQPQLVKQQDGMPWGWEVGTLKLQRCFMESNVLLEQPGECVCGCHAGAAQSERPRCGIDDIKRRVRTSDRAHSAAPQATCSMTLMRGCWLQDLL